MCCLSAVIDSVEKHLTTTLYFQQTPEKVEASVEIFSCAGMSDNNVCMAQYSSNFIFYGIVNRSRIILSQKSNTMQVNEMQI